MRRPYPGALYEAAKISGLLLVSWLVPIGWLSPVARLLRWPRRLRRSGGGATDIVIAHILGGSVSPFEAEALFQRSGDHGLEVAMQILALHRPGRQWRPVIRLRGFEHLDAALAGGAGAILWTSDFLYRPLIMPLALREAGFRGPVHLSRPEHGFSASPFAVKVLNPLWCAVENRHLTERVVIENNDASSALRRLRERLARNRIVSITVAETGRRTAEVRFLNGTLRLATGPVHLAYSTGAALLPVFAVRAADGAYEVTLGPALPVEKDGAPAYAAAVRAYAAMLEPFVRRYPDQWNGWLALGRIVEEMPSFATSFARADAIAGALAARGVRVSEPAEPANT
jgi:lauroyl/myristoyl acyltransferase